MKESTMNLVSKLIKTVVPVFLLVFAAGCASPGTPQPTISSGPDLNEVVCHTDGNIGSRLPKRTCKTRGQWMAEAKENQEDMKNVLRGAARPGDMPTLGN